MRNNSVGNRADEAQNNQLQIEFEMIQQTPQTHLIFVLERDALGLSLLLHHDGTICWLACCFAKNNKNKQKMREIEIDWWCGRRACGALGRSRKPSTVMGS